MAARLRREASPAGSGEPLEMLVQGPDMRVHILLHRINCPHGKAIKKKNTCSRASDVVSVGGPERL